MAESVHAEEIKDLVQRQEKDDDHHEVDAALDSTDSEEGSQQKEDQETKIMVKNVPNQHSQDSDNVGSTSKVKRLEAGEIKSKKKKNKVGLTEQGFKKLNEEVLIKNSKKILYEIDDPIPEMEELFKDPVLESQGLYYHHRRGRQFQPWNYPNGVYDPIPAFLDHFDINDLSLSELENFWEGLDDLDSNDE